VGHGVTRRRRRSRHSLIRAASIVLIHGKC
jgi:hypothetical protein